MLPHAIGRQTLEVEVATDAQAAQLLDDGFFLIAPDNFVLSDKRERT